jgi:hypothetical protein
MGKEDAVSCVPPKRYAEVLSLSTVGMTLLENRVFVDVKMKSLAWALN